MRIWRYQSPNPCYAKEDLELFFICPALSSKPQKPWCPWSYLEITVAEPRPLAMLLFANYGKDLRDEWHSAASFCWLLSFVDWDDLYIYSKTTRLRHTNEMQWTNWLPLTRKRYKALNVTCMLCLCVSAMATVMIFSQIPLILIWQTSLEEPEPPSIPLVLFLLNPQFLGVETPPKVIGFRSVHHLFCLETTMIFRWSRYYIPLKLIAKAPEHRPSKRINHRIPTIDFQVRSGCWFQVSGKFQGSKSDDC